MTTERAAKITAYIAEYLRTTAYERRVSQGELAKAAEVNRGTMNEYLNGRSQMPIAVLFDVCARLDINPEDVLVKAQQSA